MKIEIKSPKNNCCVVRFGSIARSDPDTEIRIAKMIDGEWKYIVKKYIDGEKMLKFPKLEPGSYHIGLFGKKIAGVATTGGHDVPFPFDVFLECPEDHSKDYQRVSVPARPRPKLTAVATGVKRGLLH